MPRPSKGLLLLAGVACVAGLSGCAVFGTKSGGTSLSSLELEAAAAVANIPSSCGRLTELLPHLEGSSDAIQASAYLGAGECAEQADDTQKALELYDRVAERFPHVIMDASGGSYSAAVEAQRRRILLIGPDDWFSIDLDALVARIKEALNAGDAEELARSASRASFAVGAVESGWTYADINESIDQLIAQPHGPIHYGPRVPNPFAVASHDVLVQTTGWEGREPFVYLWFRFDERRGWEWSGWLDSNLPLPSEKENSSLMSR